MNVKPPFHERARVVMHLDSGYTRISLIRFEGLGMANGGIDWDIPTERIPFHLRPIGTQFQFTCPHYSPERFESGEDVRWMLRQMMAGIEIREC